ncbi:MAG: ANTAR domain-containing protein [Planctomycetaceae bacterium]
MMNRTGMTEPEAFRRLQKLASETNKKLIEIATIIVTAEDAMGGVL